jgi:uncharacterized protein YecT (DUF1311 family)
LGLLSTQATAASFDCKKAASWVEKTVCANPELSKLDEEMAKAYHDALVSLSPEGQKETKEYQKQWLKERVSSCEDVIRGVVIYDKTKDCNQKCFDTSEDFTKKNENYDLINCIKKCRAPVLKQKLDFTDASIADQFTKCLKGTYKGRIGELQNILVQFPGRTFRNIYIDHSKNDKTCDEEDIPYFSADTAYTSKELTYPQIENPKNENEKLWNSVFSRKVADEFKKNENEECTDISSEYTVVFSNKYLISIQNKQDLHEIGSAYSHININLFNWLLEARRELQISDLFENKTGWRKKLTALIAKEKKKNETDNDTGLLAPVKDLETGLIDIDKITIIGEWMISKDGLVFRLYTWNMRGAILITIDWKTLDPYLSKNGRSLIHE